jgi:hypothetical protein
VWTGEGMRRREKRKLHNEELRDLSSLPSMIRMKRRMRLEGHVALCRVEFSSIKLIFQGLAMEFTNCNWAYARWQCYMKNEPKETVLQNEKIRRQHSEQADTYRMRKTVIQKKTVVIKQKS